jgi:hypothetical protein
MKYIELYNFELKLIHGFLTSSHKLNQGINFLGGMNFLIIYFICFHQNYVSMVFVKIFKVFFPKSKRFWGVKIWKFHHLQATMCGHNLVKLFYFLQKNCIFLSKTTFEWSWLFLTNWTQFFNNIENWMTPLYF